jgi:hypothetical protein
MIVPDKSHGQRWERHDGGVEHKPVDPLMVDQTLHSHRTTRPHDRS